MKQQEEEKEFRLREDLHGCFLGTGPTGQTVLLVPVTADKAPPDRTAGNVALTYRPSVSFAIRRHKFKAPAAILTCLHSDLTPTFRVVATDLANHLDVENQRPKPRSVSQQFSRWEELLRRRHALSVEEELGLWGELWTILLAPNVDGAVAGWRGPTGALTDFAGGGIGIECKTTLRRLEHHFSQQQLMRPLGETPVYVASIFVDRDEVEGRTINTLVGELREKVADPPFLERLLLQAGYSSADQSLYTQRLRTLEPPLWFPMAAIPRVRDADRGVSAIHFVARLSEGDALPQEEGAALLAQLVG